MSDTETQYYGILAEFDTPAQLMHACERVRDAGYAKWDAHSPFPVHGLDTAMGLPNSKLPWITLVLALTGTALAFTLQWWTSAVDYKFIISGKPFMSWPAFVPVTFEVTILLGALGTVFGMLGLNKLPQYYHSLFRSQRFERATDDKFFISIEAADPLFNRKQTLQFLEECGAVHIEMVEL
jgi:hypothetical protein